MHKEHKHILKNIHTCIVINSNPENIWRNITIVEIEKFSDPILFRILDIPKPLKAEVLSEGVGGKRIAYFDSGKRFIQEILIWRPFEEYSFSFNPEKGFKVGYFFDLSSGIFQILEGSYRLTDLGSSTTLTLNTTYSIDKSYYFLLNIPVKIILKIFQRYLLTSIKRNTEK